MSSACDNCPSKSGCKSQDTCPTANGQEQQKNVPTFEKLNEHSHIKKVIGVVSGKGGVGKSLVTSMLAARLCAEGYKVGIMDADITGPSIPKSFGLKGFLQVEDEKYIVPAETKNGIKVVSINLLMENEEAPVIWRGPVISGMVKQFWSEVKWGELDVLLIDMPPGTGDVPLTVFQSIPVDGIVMVSTPQDLVSMIVGKSRNMALMMGVKILGFVENMSYIKCPCCGQKLRVFGKEGNVKKAAEEMGVSVLDSLPIDSDVADLVDSGNVEDVPADFLVGSVKAVSDLLK